jgi:acetoacetate decarboxylase
MGYPKVLASPHVEVRRDCMFCTLDYNGVRVATATMTYKQAKVDEPIARRALEAPGYLLKLIPDVDGSPRICELVRYYLRDIVLKGAWTGPAALSLYPHALAPVAELPVREVISCVHLIADFTLDLGEVVHDYLD